MHIAQVFLCVGIVEVYVQVIFNVLRILAGYFLNKSDLGYFR